MLSGFLVRTKKGGMMGDKHCRYCDGICPNEPDDSEFLCDGFAGDIDGLYADEEQPVCARHGGTFDDNPGKSICKTCEDWE